MPRELTQKSLLDLELAIAAKDITPVDVVDAYLAEIEEHNERLNAYVLVTAEEARAEAKALTEELATSGPRGPLHGVPFAVKDLMDTKGVRTTYGSALFADHVPTEDAEPVRRLREAGAILLGKTNTHEFAAGPTTNNPHYGPTHNPHKQGHIPGGSSGGSAAAVTAHLAPLATGTDTGGSIRMPAAACGCVGIKPTWGRVSQRGTFPMDPTYDHVGPIARSARDCAIAMNIIAGYDPRDPWSPPQIAEEEFTRLLGRKMKGKKIGYAPDFEVTPVQRAVWENLERALKTFESLGCEIVEVKLPDPDEVMPVAWTLIPAGTALSHANLFPGNEDKYGDDVRAMVEMGRQLSGEAVLAAQRRRAEVKRAFEQVLASQVNALVLPTLSIEAPEIGATEADVDGTMVDVIAAMAAYTAVHDTTQLPAISTPTGFGPNGLPTAIQIATGPNQDSLALGLADALETAT